MEKKMNNKGFSLVELIVVIAIMAVLIGVLAPQFIKYVEKSRVSTDVQNVDQVVTAIQTYAAENGFSADTWILKKSGGTDADGTKIIGKALEAAGLTKKLELKSSEWKYTEGSEKTGIKIVVSDTTVKVFGENGTGDNKYTFADGKTVE